jgi:hypothetical protein
MRQTHIFRGSLEHRIRARQVVREMLAEHVRYYEVIKHRAHIFMRIDVGECASEKCLARHTLATAGMDDHD